MHEKYVFLQRSYSAPVRVDDISVDDAVSVARAITGVALRAVFGVPLRAVAALRDMLVVGSRVMRDVVIRAFVAVIARGTNVVVRGVVLRFTVVVVRDWDGCDFISDLLRETAVPSRTAPLATPMQTSRFAMKIRILFISEQILANF